MTRQATQSAPNEINMIGAGTVVDGTLHSEGGIRVSGRVVGTLRVDGKAMIAEEGTVEGELIASSADVAGTVKGDLHVAERLVLKGTARIDGNIKTGRLVVEEGAVFTGECGMGEALTGKRGQPSAAAREQPDRLPSANDENNSKPKQKNGRSDTTAVKK